MVWNLALSEIHVFQEKLYQYTRAVILSLKKEENQEDKFLQKNKTGLELPDSNLNLPKALGTSWKHNVN